MAGLYADPYAERMAYDIDGSLGYTFDGSTGIVQLGSADLAVLNNEDPADGVAPPVPITAYSYLGIIFPQLRDLALPAAMWYSASNADVTSLETSVDTTTGADGTWVSQGAGTGSIFRDLVSTGATKPVVTYRTRMANGLGSTASGVKAMRLKFGSADASAKVTSLILYGTIASGQTPDRLRFWHPTSDQALSLTPALLDFGDVLRATTYTKTFRVKNNSSTLTAHSPVISLEASTDSTVITQASEMALSTNGTTFTSTVTLSDLAPGAISGVITLRRVKASASPLGPWAQRLRAVATSWS